MTAAEWRARFQQSIFAIEANIRELQDRIEMLEREVAAEQPTLRDRFAMAALTGLYTAVHEQRTPLHIAIMVGMAWDAADAMLTARQPKKEAE